MELVCINPAAYFKLVFESWMELQLSVVNNVNIYYHIDDYGVIKE